MELTSDRIHRGRPTPHAHERKALDQIYPAIPDQDPYQVWELHELYDPSSGRLYEIDLLLLSRVGLFLVEIKSHRGALTGDIVDWTFQDAGRRSTLECPFPGANLKSKVLAGLLERQLGRERPWIHTAVFLPNVTDIRLEGGRPPWLLTSKDVGERLRNGLENVEPRSIVNKPVMKALLQAASRIGLRPSRSARIVGGYRLGTLVDDGEGYQEHLAKHTAVETDTARVRSYLVPAATTTERRSLLQRAAQREAQVLAGLGQHPGILAYRAFVEDAPLGPAVVFEAVEDALPLHIFLRQHPELSFDERLGILQQVVEALAHCHRHGVWHRNLSPASVLVHHDATGVLRVRLHRFQTAAWQDHSSLGTRHMHELVHAIDRLYQAPEVLSDPDKGTLESDVFSVGCLTWLLFTGQHPAATLAERDLRIRGTSETDGGLRPSGVQADLAVLDDAVADATRPNRHARADDITAWFDVFLGALTRPAVPVTPEADPRKADKGDTLPGGLRVERRVGKGATALVLLVRREGRELALKVPHDEACGARLLAEAEVLRDLRHEHIVALREVITLGGFPCLLLEYAGDKTFGDLVREQGALPLEIARRYGDDLLSAVQYLEEAGVTHRDIKPGNVGFTNLAKKQSHLLLLDFSLSPVDASFTSAGTAEWRDPWLWLRPEWDAAADRWSAAAVLYHALTGAGPLRREPGREDDAVLIEAERLDAGVRDRVGAFFRTAFARDPAARFQTAETMRQSWSAALAPGEDRVEPTPGVDLDQARLDTPVDALPLSARARNALDRAGVATVGEMLLLPRNQLSVIRGVGTLVAREIVAIADLLRPRLTAVSAEPFLPGFLRPRLGLDDPELELPALAQDALAGAGLTTTLDVAQAPLARVRRLLDEHTTITLLARLQILAAEEPTPGSLADWVRALIGRASETDASRRIRLLTGLDPLPEGQREEGHPAARSVPQVAAALGIEAAQIHASLQFLRTRRWAGNEVVTSLVETLHGLLASRAPAAPLGVLARDLATLRAGEGATAKDERLAAALIRVALELRPNAPAEWRRIGTEPWVGRDRGVFDVIAALGEAADHLAATEPLPATETVRSALSALVVGTPLAELPLDRHVGLAAQASTSAAASARLELYPRGMDAGRALTLCLGALAGEGLTVDAVRRRVAARFPEATPLPARPELDAMLAPGLVFVPDLPGGGQYIRPGSHSFTSATVQVPSVRTLAPTGLPTRQSPDAQRAAAFRDQLERGVNPGRFRVVQVRADLAVAATEALARVLGVQPVSLDHALHEAIRATAAELEVAWSNVEAADRAGPDGPDWPLLEELVRQAADGLVERLLAPGTRPLLLAWPGALARYGLAGALSRIVERSERGDAPPVLLVVPSHVDGLPPSINGRLPVPAPLLAQRLVMPDVWLSYVPRSAEAE